MTDGSAGRVTGVEPARLTSKYVRHLAPGWLMVRPDAVHYGHLALELQMSLVLARMRRAGLVVYHAEPWVNEGLFEIESPDVPMIRPGPVGRTVCAAAWWPQELLNGRTVFWHHALEAWRGSLEDELAGYATNPRVPDPVRRAMKGLKKSLPQLPALDTRAYYRRRLLREEVPVRLRPAAHEQALRDARALGLAPDVPIVTVHAREAGFKLGHESHDKGRPAPGEDSAGFRDDSTRNIDITGYFEAIDALVAKGFTVVRLGDPSMRPVSRPGLIDLATSPHRTALLEVFCLLRSTFLIAGESGPLGAAYLTNTPTLNVNATDPISAYPIRANGLYLLKRVVDRRTGETVTPEAMLTPSFLAHVRDTIQYEYLDNTPADIVRGVGEMLDLLDRGVTPSEGQVRFKALAVEASATVRLQYVRKWGADDGFMGDGWIARASIE
ncbi:MAG: TIGR04372 family glycosyltransferase [Vicinamibacterales bacterium]